MEGEEEAVGVNKRGELQVAADKVVVPVADSGDLGERGNEGLIVVEAVDGVDVVTALGSREGAPDWVLGIGFESRGS